ARLLCGGGVRLDFSGDGEGGAPVEIGDDVPMFERIFFGRPFFLGRRGFGRKGDLELGAYADAALDADFTAHRLGEAADERKTDAGTLEFPGGRRVDLPEAFEDPGQHIGRNADAAVFDG